MAPSRTIGEQTVLERTAEVRGSAMDFSTSSDVPVDDVATASGSSKSVHAPRFDVTTDSSRDVLLTDVWGYKYTGGTRTVDVHVRRLREKLPFLTAAILTVKQFGYKLVDPPPS